MANLYITEFSDSGITPNWQQIPVIQLPSLANQTVVFDSVSVQSAAVGTLTRLVRLMADANCFVTTGASPTAVTQVPLVANVPEYFQVPAKQSFKFAVIARA